MKTFSLIVIGFLAGSLLGNLRGDQLTLKDCATKGKAIMAGGGSITCGVVRETP